MKCPNPACKHEVDPSWERCPYCGISLRKYDKEGKKPGIPGWVWGLIGGLIIGGVIIGIAFNLRGQAAPVNTGVEYKKPENVRTVPEKPLSALPTALSTGIPSRTPTRVRAPTSTPQPQVYYPFQGCLPSRLYKGAPAYVSFDGGDNGLRSEPDSTVSNITAKAYSGQPFLVIDGPECDKAGWILWEVSTIQNARGWTTEGNGSEFWLVPFAGWNACPGAPLSYLHKGDQAYISFYPNSANNVRQSPNLSAAKVGKLYPGEQVNVLDGPRCSDNRVWWHVQSLQQSLTGWTGEGDNKYAWLVPIPRP